MVDELSEEKAPLRIGKSEVGDRNRVQGSSDFDRRRGGIPRNLDKPEQVEERTSSPKKVSLLRLACVFRLAFGFDLPVPRKRQRFRMIKRKIHVGISPISPQGEF